MPTLRPKIAQLCLKKLYPPRIVLGVVPGEPTQDKVVVRVSFSGAVGCVAGSKPSFPLLLAKPMLSPGVCVFLIVILSIISLPHNR